MRNTLLILSAMLGFCSTHTNAQQVPVVKIAISNVTEKVEPFVIVDKLKFHDFNKNGKLDTYEDFRKPIEVRAKDLLFKMTTEEKLVKLQSLWISRAKLFRQNKSFIEKALEAFSNGLGETKQVSFTITPDKLQFYDINMKEVIETSYFYIVVGSSFQTHNTNNLTVL